MLPDSLSLLLTHAMLLKPHNWRFIIAIFNLLVAAYLAAQEKLQVGNHEGDEGDDEDESAQQPEDDLQRVEPNCDGTEDELESAREEYVEHLKKEDLAYGDDYTKKTEAELEHGFSEFCDILADLVRKEKQYGRV